MFIPPFQTEAAHGNICLARLYLSADEHTLLDSNIINDAMEKLSLDGWSVYLPDDSILILFRREQGESIQGYYILFFHKY